MLRTAVLTVALALSGTAMAQLKTQAPKTPTAAAPVPVTMSTAQAEPTLESARRIERTKAIKLVKEHKAVFVDVRAKESYDAGHIKGAMNIPEFELIQRLKEIPPGKMIITYCA